MDGLELDYMDGWGLGLGLGLDGWMGYKQDFRVILMKICPSHISIQSLK